MRKHIKTDHYSQCGFKDKSEFDVIEQSLALMKELNRILKPGSILRLSLSNLKKYISFYHNREESLADFKKRWMHGTEAIWSLIQNWGHVSVWDNNLVKSILHDLNFVQISHCDFRQRLNPELCIEKPERQWESFYIEARK